MEDMSDCTIGFYWENTENKLCCNTGRELNKDFVEYKWVVSVQVMVYPTSLVHTVMYSVGNFYVIFH